MKGARSLALTAVLALTASSGFALDRKPPRPGPPRPLKLPPVRTQALSNGLPVLVVETHEVPAVEVLLVIGAGAAADPLDRTGLAAMTANMLDEGAGGRDSLALADAIDFLGAELVANSSWDSSTVRLHVPVARLADALPLLADVALRPDFPERELSRLRKEALTEILQARDEPREIANRALARAVFGPNHRYGWPERGDVASLKAVTVEELRAFHRSHYVPGSATLIAIGDVNDSVLPLLEKSFGSWPKGEVASIPLAKPQAPRGRQLWLVDKPDAPQSVIRIGRVGPPRSTPDYHALSVMNTLLGGSFTSRLNDNLREQHGYAYGARSVFSFRREAGFFLAAADVQTPSTSEALREFLKELDRIRTPATADEVERARNYLALGYPEDFESTRQIAAQLAERVVYGLPENTFDVFVPRVLAIAPKDVAAVARTYLSTADLAIVVVGDRKTIEPKLAAIAVAPLKTMTIDEVMGSPPSIE
jgi:zinc protease